MSIGGLTTQRVRPRRKRVPMLRAFLATHRDGALTCRRGAWVKEAGGDAERCWDPNARLACNLGDLVVVMWADGEAYAVVTGIEGGWNERWTVRASGAVPNGDVRVMSAKGITK